VKTFGHFCGVMLRCATPETQVTAVEREILAKHCRDAKVTVEIGCYEGCTTALLASHSAGIVFSIDPFPRGRLGLSYGKWIAQTHFRRLRLSNVKLLEGYSHAVAPRFVEPIDFLFIDGDHTLSGAQRDWEDWLPKVRAGGIIAAHDCKQAINSPGRIGSMEYYDSCLTRLQTLREIESAHSLAIFRKVA
jgi:predicted O-methyltransferase YrrM